MQSNASYPNSDQLTDAAQNAAQTAKDALVDAANQAKNKTREMSQTAIEKLEEGRVTAGSSLQSAAATLHQKADDLPGVRKASNLAHSTADTLNNVGSYLRDNDTKAMMADVEHVVKNHPTHSLLIAAAFGFILGRALRNQ